MKQLVKQSRRNTTYKNSEAEGAAKVAPLLPKTEKQKTYIDALNTQSQIIVSGYSGTGKTYLAATKAGNMYALGEVDKIIVTRPNVSVGKDLGFFKGSLEEKMEPWAAPVMDVLKEQLGRGTVETGMKNGNIEVAPISTMRGRSFHDAFVILDEASNTTIPEMIMFLTRIGENCKVVINGDIRQQDIKGESGLLKALTLANKYDIDVAVIEFGIEDIVRSKQTKDWIVAFTEEGDMK